MKFHRTESPNGTRIIRALVVEDEIEISDHLKDLLRGAGFVVDCASDGDTGWYMGDVNIYDAVVLDVGLPDLSGLDVLKRWRARGRAMPVLVLSGCDVWSERVDGLDVRHQEV